jgi:4-diphosphocytidyl-2-C-methyl-D-erythritol kinase
MPSAGSAQPDLGEFAPAKVNLCLHVTGRRADGYHLLDSLVVFAGVGDRVSAMAGRGLSLHLTGPEAMALGSETDNLVLRAARLMGAGDVALTLDKKLPVASGIGGGSADAAATLRLLAQWTGRSLPDPEAVLRLGADVPVCLAGQPVRMRGVGEDLSPLPPLPPVWLVLVNPRVPVPTPQVFAAVTRRDNQPIPVMPTAALGSTSAFADWLGSETRNDLVDAARHVAPVLKQVQAALEAVPGCLLARMSGSGGTHFGLFASESAATTAVDHLRATHPDWWVAAGRKL